MAIYFIGKSQREIENINIFAGSETIYGMNENENYAMFSLTDEDNQKQLTETQHKTAIESLRMGMEKFKLFDNEAVFVFNDKQLMEKVMKITAPELMVSNSEVKLVENLNEFNNAKKV